MLKSFVLYIFSSKKRASTFSGVMLLLILGMLFCVSQQNKEEVADKEWLPELPDSLPPNPFLPGDSLAPTSILGDSLIDEWVVVIGDTAAVWDSLPPTIEGISDRSRDSLAVWRQPIEFKIVGVDTVSDSSPTVDSLAAKIAAIDIIDLRHTPFQISAGLGIMQYQMSKVRKLNFPVLTISAGNERFQLGAMYGLTDESETSQFQSHSKRDRVVTEIHKDVIKRSLHHLVLLGGEISLPRISLGMYNGGVISPVNIQETALLTQEISWVERILSSRWVETTRRKGDMEVTKGKYKNVVSMIRKSQTRRRTLQNDYSNTSFQGLTTFALGGNIWRFNLMGHFIFSNNLGEINSVWDFRLGDLDGAGLTVKYNF